MENIKFRLQKIETKQFAMLPDAYDSKAPKFEFYFGISFAFPDIESRIVFTSCLIKYQGEISPFLILEVGLYFEVEEGSWIQMINKETNQIHLPRSTAHHMMSLLVGTARGILHSKTENTEFNRHVLPTINLSELIEGDVIQSFSVTEAENKDQ